MMGSTVIPSFGTSHIFHSSETRLLSRREKNNFRGINHCFNDNPGRNVLKECIFQRRCSPRKSFNRRALNLCDRRKEAIIG